MNLLIDFINPQGIIAITEQIDKISYNLEQLPSFKSKIYEFKKTRDAISSMTVAGRWILIYKANSNNDENTTLTFIDFRIDIDNLDVDTFSQSIISGVKQLQSQYDNIFNPELDNVELTFADINELVIKSNLFVCNEDIFVLTKASQLGALPIVESLKEGDKIKVVFCDEKQDLNGLLVVNAYAFINFNGNELDKGYVYLKLFDLINNSHLISDFQVAIEQLGVKFDRAFFMEKFSLDKLN